MSFALKKDIYSVGVLNPAMRVFDIIMKTEYGTSYNAYLVRGNKKNALVETVHVNFFDEYIANIESIMPVSQIDYVIVNHTEPDHSGSIAKLLQMNPNITIVGSMAALKYLENIANCDFQKMPVKDNDVLDLGGKTVRFMIAPFLHWPDSMFSYVEEEKVLFSCDFLGAHYCEPRMIDTRASYPTKYESAFLNYYTAIFSPFKEFVLKGLDKIKDLPIDMIAPSHGPVLTDTIKTAMDKYQSWSAGYNDALTSQKVAIIYVSAYGCTKKMAKIAFNVLEKKGFEPVMYDAIDYDTAFLAEEFCQSRAVMIGSPTINRDALKPIWDVLSSVDAIAQRGKKCAVFGSYGWSGEAVGMVKNRLSDLKMNVFGDGCRAIFIPNDEEIDKMHLYAEEFADSIK